MTLLCEDNAEETESHKTAEPKPPGTTTLSDAELENQLSTMDQWTDGPIETKWWYHVITPIMIWHGSRWNSTLEESGARQRLHVESSQRLQIGASNPRCKPWASLAVSYATSHCKWECRPKWRTTILSNRIPSRALTYPTFGKGESSSGGYLLLRWELFLAKPSWVMSWHTHMTAPYLHLRGRTAPGWSAELNN